MNRPLWLAGAAVIAVLSAGAVWVGASVSSPAHISTAPAPSPSKPSSAPKRPPAPGVSQVGTKVYYTVQPFDVRKREGTLTFIAHRFRTTVGQLVMWNNIKDPGHIGVHQRLRVR